MKKDGKHSWIGRVLREIDGFYLKNPWFAPALSAIALGMAVAALLFRLAR